MVARATNFAIWLAWKYLKKIPCSNYVGPFYIIDFIYVNPLHSSGAATVGGLMHPVEMRSTGATGVLELDLFIYDVG